MVRGHALGRVVRRDRSSWGVRLGTCRRTLSMPATTETATGPLDAVRSEGAVSLQSIGWHADGKTIVTSYLDLATVIWDLAKPDPVNILVGHGHYARFLPRGRHLLTVNATQNMSLWAFDDNVRVWTIELPVAVVARTLAVRFALERDIFFVVQEIRVLQVRGLHDGNVRGNARGHTDVLTAAAFSPDGKWLLTAAHDRTLRIWNAASTGCVWVSRRMSDPVLDLEFNRDGAFFTTVASNGTLVLWETLGEALPEDGVQAARERERCGPLGFPAPRWARGLGRSASPSAVRVLYPASG